MRDLSPDAHSLNREINTVLVRHGLTDADITRQYQTQMKRGRLKWIQYTRQISLPPEKYSRLKTDIRSAADGFDFEESERTPQEAQIKISYGEAVLADITFSLIPEKGLLAIIIDDLGYSRNIEPFTSLGIPLTYAVIPGLQFSRNMAETLRAGGLYYIIHMPMEPHDSTLVDDKSMLLVSMDETRIRASLSSAFESVPGARGLNNHMGSKFTSNPDAVGRLVKVLKEKNFFLVDSRTSGESVAYSIARKFPIPAAQNNFFIDNQTDYDYIYKRMEELTRLAASRESTVAIGHVQNLNTARVIGEFIPAMKKAGITFVTVEDILK